MKLLGFAWIFFFFFLPHEKSLFGFFFFGVLQVSGRNVTHASTAVRQIYDTLGTCSFPLPALPADRLHFANQSVAKATGSPHLSLGCSLFCHVLGGWIIASMYGGVGARAASACRTARARAGGFGSWESLS